MKHSAGMILYLFLGILLAASAARPYRHGGFPAWTRDFPAWAVVAEAASPVPGDGGEAEEGFPGGWTDAPDSGLLTESGGNVPGGEADSPERAAENLRRIRDGLADGSFRLIAHRGYSAKAPENTLPAFMAASQAGFDCVETDLRFTADGHGVLIHNERVDHTSDGTGAVEDLTLEELRKLDFGGWYDEAYTGTRIPTLEEGLVLCKVLGLGLYLELKVPEMTGEQYQWVIDTVRRYGMEEKTTFISFYLTCLRGIAERDAGFGFRFLTIAEDVNEELEGTDATVAEAAAFLQWVQGASGNAGIAWNSAHISPALERAVRGTGLALDEWTVDDPEEALSVPASCTAVITNRVTKAALQERLAALLPPEADGTEEENQTGPDPSDITLYRFVRI